jgi:hypothetical protein
VALAAPLKHRWSHRCASGAWVGELQDSCRRLSGFPGPNRSPLGGMNEGVSGWSERLHGAVSRGGAGKTARNTVLCGIESRVR